MKKQVTIRYVESKETAQYLYQAGIFTMKGTDSEGDVWITYVGAKASGSMIEIDYSDRMVSYHVYQAGYHNWKIIGYTPTEKQLREWLILKIAEKFKVEIGAENSLVNFRLIDSYAIVNKSLVRIYTANVKVFSNLKTEDEDIHDVSIDYCKEGKSGNSVKEAIWRLYCECFDVR